MKFFSAPASMVALLVVFAALVFAPPLPVATSSAGVLDDSSLDDEAKAGAQIAQQLGVTEVLGPLAPVAMSPFFALTVMSGASVLSDTDVLPDWLMPDAISKNAFLGKGSPLNNGFVFAGLLGLTAVTALPKLTKVTKPFAQAIDQLEAHSGIVGVLAVQGLSRMRLGDDGGPEVTAAVVQAGVWTFTVSTLLMVFSAINIFVVNTVKFFFEMMIFLSPLPTVDAIFEATNKAVAAALVSIYLWNPYIATILNLIIFAISLVIFAWIHRRVVYLRSIFGDPFLGWLAGLFGRPSPTANSTRLTGALAEAAPNPTIVVKAFVGKKFGGLPRKAKGLLVQTDGKLLFLRRRFLRAPQIVPLPQAGHSVQADKGFLANSIVLENDVGDVVAKVLFSRRYNSAFEEIRSRLGATSETAAGVDDTTLATAGMMGVGRKIGQAIAGEGRAAIRAELG